MFPMPGLHLTPSAATGALQLSLEWHRVVHEYAALPVRPIRVPPSKPDVASDAPIRACNNREYATQYHTHSKELGTWWCTN